MTTKPIRPRNAWAITHPPSGTIVLLIGEHRRSAIEEACRSWESSWKDLKKDGFAVTKIVIQPR